MKKALKLALLTLTLTSISISAFAMEKKMVKVVILNEMNEDPIYIGIPGQPIKAISKNMFKDFDIPTGTEFSIKTIDDSTKTIDESTKNILLTSPAPSDEPVWISISKDALGELKTSQKIK